MPATHAILHGVVFDILVGSERRVGLAAVFPDDDRRIAVARRGAARGFVRHAAIGLKADSARIGHFVSEWHEPEIVHE